MNDTLLKSPLLGKVSLATLIVGLAIWGLGLYTGHDDIAVTSLLISLVLAFGLGVCSRQDSVGKITMYISGVLAVVAIVNYIVFTGLNAGEEYDADEQSPATQLDTTPADD